MPSLESAKFSLRSVAAIVASILAMGSVGGSGVWYTATILSGIRNELRTLSASIEDVRVNSYTLSKASEQALRTAIENPGMKVPDPRDPNRVIVVKPGGPSANISFTDHP